MTVHIALLRGVNVGGRKAVSMADLRSLAAGLGLTEPRTLLQSGNLVFGADGQAGEALERLLETELHARLGLESSVMVRTAAEWSAAIAANPFAAEAAADPGHLLLMALKTPPAPGALSALRAAIKGPERSELDGRHAWLVYPDGIGDSRLTNVVIERCLGVRGTARNWNTVLKLQASAA